MYHLSNVNSNPSNTNLSNTNLTSSNLIRPFKSSYHHDPAEYEQFSDAEELAMLATGVEPIRGPYGQLWQDANKAWLDALYRNNTWEVVPYPTGRKIVDCKWVFKHKLDADGDIARYKAPRTCICPCLICRSWTATRSVAPCSIGTRCMHQPRSPFPFPPLTKTNCWDNWHEVPAFVFIVQKQKNTPVFLFMHEMSIVSAVQEPLKMFVVPTTFIPVRLYHQPLLVALASGQPKPS